MRRALLLALEVIFIAALAAVMYFNYRDKKAVYRRPKLITNTSKLHFLDKELEEELIFFLSRELDFQEGEFEIVSAVNLGTADLAGADYIVLTIRSSNGKVIQIALSKSVYPWSKWQVLKSTLKVSGRITPLYAQDDDSAWIESLGVTREQLNEYYFNHPQMTQEELKNAFVDKITGLHILPDDWQESAGPTVKFRLETDKDKGFRIIANIAGDKSSDTYWKADYPGYVGPGYRSYLYDKIQQSKQ